MRSSFDGSDRKNGTPTEDVSRRHEALVQLLTAEQGRLFSFIYSLLPDPDRARDVLQETNLLIWRKSDEFVEGTNFRAWTSKIAHFKVLSHLRGMERDRHLFDEDLINQLVLCAIRNVPCF